MLEQKEQSWTEESKWTDGKGMWTTLRGVHRWRGVEDVLYRGTRCYEFFWQSQARSLGTQGGHRNGYRGNFTMPDTLEETVDLFPEATLAEFVTNSRELLNVALESDAVDTPGRELWVRMRIMWRDNDPLRVALDPPSNIICAEMPGVKLVSGEVQHSPAFEQNAHRLLGMFNVSDPSELLLSADLLRQLRRFDESLALLATTADVFQEAEQRELAAPNYDGQFNLLKSTTQTENLTRLSRFIAKCAQDQDMLVRLVSDAESFA